MAEDEKNYRASTGVDEFYYGKGLKEKEVDTIERVKFLQNINVEMPQEIVRAHGDNTTAEMAVASGNVSVTSQFHKIPIQDKTYLLGWEVSEDGLKGSGSSDNPPYVPVIFAKTYEDGHKEYVGLPKGMFTRPTITGATKGETTEFSSEEIVAQFMDREVDGFNKDHSVVFAEDALGETTQRDLLFQKIFGKPHPNAGEESEPEGA